MLTLILVLVVIWVIAGVIGFVVHGLFWLFVIACVLFALTLIFGGIGHGRRSVRPPR